MSEEGDFQFDQRQPRQRESKYLGFIAGLPCIACFVRLGRFTRPVQVAHCRANYEQAEGRFWRPVGKAEKPHDRRSTPLCVKCHLTGKKRWAQHGANEEAWWAELGIYPPAFCKALGEAYDAGTPGLPVLMKFAAMATALRAGR